MNIIKKLPKVYQNSINKKINNNKESFYSLTDSDKNSINQINSDINLIIDGLFNNKEHHIYSIPVIIETSTKIYDTFLVSRTDSYLLTIDRDKINIKEINSIKRKNP